MRAFVFRLKHCLLDWLEHQAHLLRRSRLWWVLLNLNLKHL